MKITYAWRADLTDAQLVALTEAHGGNAEPGWWDRARRHSLGWVSAHDGDDLVGFANLAWDGADHAFLLDPKVHADWQHRGIGTELVGRARDAARDAGCEWLHVDFEPHLRPFYFGSCGFVPTDAGLIRLTAS
ncbi:GNAT family N-acetyltransferase [Amycolatopsis echigonensis]|uniref:Acetyltransferase (GNAT) family protein n=1 Tax=Amycolatopsis echigonensis TaxID=2576905 RepID=A0A2N3WU48_9PSEU|nr:MULTISPECIES: GNAT family N-acetyltransferase [Amycolatopsis]MBB2503504.1 GNAT family N-acetyltransferase [Amycolatopsis echigonensis]PKV97384.1 acetyltransferase (GNAT) family protein [Amycolatopsis niigatensis]